MANIDYTLVIGVDARHLYQLSLVYPTWRKHKPGLMAANMVIFYDRSEVKEEDIKRVIQRDAALVAWPPDDVVYEGNPKDKWTNPQRAKMLSGFVHVPAMVVTTEYWLKLDTDVVATGRSDWIQGSWFDDPAPAIVCHRWGFTRPADQFLKLDAWVAENRSKLELLSRKPALNMVPAPGAERISHPRIISWCGFFCTALTKYASQCARSLCGEGKLPVPSQDGYLWYCASRLKLPIIRTNMKSLGWQHWSNDENVLKYSKEAMKCLPV